MAAKSDWVFAIYPENQMSPTKAIVRVWYKGVEIEGLEGCRETYVADRFELTVSPSVKPELYDLEDGQLPPGIVPNS